MDKDWHEEHFTCVKCEKPLKREKFVAVDDKPCCTECYNMNVASVCDGCGQAIGPGSKDIIVRDRHWHENCFRCSNCNKQLVSMTKILSFIIVYRRVQVDWFVQMCLILLVQCMWRCVEVLDSVVRIGVLKLTGMMMCAHNHIFIVFHFVAK